MTFHLKMNLSTQRLFAVCACILLPHFRAKGQATGIADNHNRSQKHSLRRDTTLGATRENGNSEAPKKPSNMFMDSVPFRKINETVRLESPNDFVSSGPTTQLSSSSPGTTGITSWSFEAFRRRLGCSWMPWKHSVVCTGENLSADPASATGVSANPTPKMPDRSSKWKRRPVPGKIEGTKSRKKESCKWDTTHKRCVLEPSNLLPPPPASAEALPGTWASSKKHRIAVLIQGRSARPKCTSKSRTRQLSAAGTQKKEVFDVLQKKLGVAVHVFLATNDCGGGYADRLKDAYRPFLRGAAFDDCRNARAGDDAIGKKCLINRALALLDSAGPSSYDLVLFMRPDLEFTEHGHELALAMVADKTRITWSSKCEHDAWVKWWCVNDVMLAIPEPLLGDMREDCFGYRSCVPENHLENPADGPKRQFDFYWPTDNPRLIFSGHGCYRCAVQKLPKSARLGFAFDVERDANTRKRIGKNSYYSFAEE